MARLSQPLRTVKAVFVRDLRGGKVVYKREQYNLVILDWGDGTPRQSFIEPTGGRSKSLNESEELYDSVEFFDKAPFPACRIGY